MPRYRITDKATGQQMVVVRDTPPSDADAQQFFANQPPAPGVQPAAATALPGGPPPPSTVGKVMDWLTDVSEGPGLAGKAVRGVANAADVVRYGMTQKEKDRLTQTGQIPGQPPPFLPTGEQNPEAIRYASQYLAMKKGFLPPALVTLGNNIAFEDQTRTPQQAQAIKLAGQHGAEAALGLQNHPYLAALTGALGTLPGPRGLPFGQP